MEEVPEGPWESEPVKDQPYVVEIFAGDAVFSGACARAGLRVGVPDDVRWGGTNFTDPSSICTLELKLERWAKVARPLVVHFAPPCATFSRARDRSRRTRVRTRNRPEGLHPVPGFVQDANEIASAVYDLALQAAHDWGVWVSMENPSLSYIWPFLGEDHLQDESCKDVVLAACRFGAPYRKPNEAAVLELVPQGLGKDLHVERWGLQLWANQGARA